MMGDHTISLSIELSIEGGVQSDQDMMEESQDAFLEMVSSTSMVFFIGSLPKSDTTSKLTVML
jgi:hypothetical protein